MLTRLFLICCVLIACFAVVGYAAGWVKFQGDEQRATIEVETGQVKEAAESAVERGKEFVEEAGATIENLGKDDSDSQPPSDA